MTLPVETITALDNLAPKYDQLRAAERDIDETVAGVVAGWVADNYPTATAAVFDNYGDGRPRVRHLKDGSGNFVTSWNLGSFALSDLQTIARHFTVHAHRIMAQSTRQQYILDLTPYLPAVAAAEVVA